MIPQLVERIVPTTPFKTKEEAAAIVLGADPLDLTLHMEQVLNAFNPWAPNPPPGGKAREFLWKQGAFFDVAPTANPAWDHFGYGYVIENTRAVQILRRVVREYRSGEGMGMPSVATQRWLDATETLLFGAANPITQWLSTSTLRPDPEAVRRNAYWRLFGLDLSFGADDNRPPTYDKAGANNGSFVRLFEELLFELWQAITNVRNTSGTNATDDDRIYDAAQQLTYMLRSRRQLAVLAREELAAAAALGWVELTLSANTPVVVDLKAQATSPADRLRIIGERVGLPAHSKSAAFFAMASDISVFLRLIESGLVSGTDRAFLLYADPTLAPDAIGPQSKRLITEWAAATGKDIKARGKPVTVTSRPLIPAQ